MINSKVLSVNEYVIQNAVRGSSRHCMIADTIRESIPGAYSVDVTGETIRFNLEETRYYFSMPAKIAKILADWDDNIDPKPFRFQIQNPLTAPIKRRPKGQPVRHYKKRDEKDGKPGRHDIVDARRMTRRRNGLKVIEVAASKELHRGHKRANIVSGA